MPRRPRLVTPDVIPGRVCDDGQRDPRHAQARRAWRDRAPCRRGLSCPELQAAPPGHHVDDRALSTTCPELCQRASALGGALLSLAFGRGVERSAAAGGRLSSGTAHRPALQKGPAEQGDGVGWRGRSHAVARLACGRRVPFSVAVLRLIARLSGSEWGGGGGGAALLARVSVPLSPCRRPARAAVLGDTAGGRAGGSLLRGWMAQPYDVRVICFERPNRPPPPSVGQV